MGKVRGCVEELSGKPGRVSRCDEWLKVEDYVIRDVYAMG
jgi:hypothetical protein